MNEKEVTEQAAGGVEAAAAAEVLPEAPLAELQAQAARATQYYDQLLRATADFENFKKRAARERQDAVKYANEALLERLIPVLDNFEMALAAAAAPGTSVASMQAGVTMIQQQLRAAMTESGLEEVNAAGAEFDPNVHEAISQQETPEVPEGRVVQQVRKGYKLRDRLLRPASVIVAKAPAA